jgi:hypothetical protein
VLGANEIAGRALTISDDPVTCSIDATDQISFDSVTCAPGYKKDPPGGNACTLDCLAPFTLAGGVCTNPETGLQVISHGDGEAGDSSKFSYTVEKIPRSDGGASANDTLLVFIKLKNQPLFGVWAEDAEARVAADGDVLYKVNFGESQGTVRSDATANPLQEEITGGIGPMQRLGGVPTPVSAGLMTQESFMMGFNSLVSVKEISALNSAESLTGGSIKDYSQIPSAAANWVLSPTTVAAPVPDLNSWPPGSWINILKGHWGFGHDPTEYYGAGKFTVQDSGIPRGFNASLGAAGIGQGIPNNNSGSFSLTSDHEGVSGAHDVPGAHIIIAQFTIPSTHNELKFKGVLIGGTVVGREQVKTTSGWDPDQGAYYAAMNACQTASSSTAEEYASCTTAAATSANALSAAAATANIWQNDPTMWGEAFDITIPASSPPTTGNTPPPPADTQGFANIGEQNNKKKKKKNLLNMNNTHQNLLFVLLIIVIFFLFKDKM